jgi:hypothetical protein
LWFNDPRNYAKMRVLRDDIDPASIMGNEVPQWYERAVKDCFGVSARFYWGASVADIERALYNGRGVLATLVEPGHYIAIVAGDNGTGEFIYHDPWPNNKWPEHLQGTPGRSRRIKYADLCKNIKQFRVEIGK